MKKLFCILLAILAVASVYTRMSLSDQLTARPIIAWKSDPNPQRHDQIALFHKWQIANGLTDKTGLQKVEMVLDSASNQSTLIQAVSGVGGDIIDNVSVLTYVPLGVCAPLTEYAAGSEFHYGKTYPTAQSLFVSNGVQYGYPCNLAVQALLFNTDTLAAHGVAELPAEWTPAEFEAIGRRFVLSANAGLERNRYYFVGVVDSDQRESFIRSLVRSQGIDYFNETLTASQVGEPRFAAALERIYKWTFVDRLFPSAAEVASMNQVASGYGGATLSQLQHGLYASVLYGRYAVIRLREAAKPINLASTQLPMGEFKNMYILARNAILYMGSKDKNLSSLFFRYLADKPYNDYIISAGDGLPPNPRFALGNPEYLSPPRYPNEGNIHANELKWAMSIAIPGPASPYFKSPGAKWMVYAIDRHFNGLASAKEAMVDAQERFNAGIADALKANPYLKTAWEDDVKLQRAIDKCKENGAPIPAEWVKNPYYLAYYRAKGMLRENAPPGGKGMLANVDP